MVDVSKFPVSCCPKCGGTTMEIVVHISGEGSYYVDMETGEQDSTEIHSYLRYRNKNKYAKCADCRMRLFKVDEQLNVLK